MINEAYISFETAKLLKEKGFMNGAYTKFFASGYDSKGNILNIRDTELKDYPRPTLQMAMKWLFEKFGLFISVQLTGCVECGFSCSISKVERDGNGWITDRKELNHSSCFNRTYDGALEDGIRYCLENYV